jgi:hypothetical protein
VIFATIARNNFDTQHESATADVTYERVLVLQAPQTAQKLITSLYRIRRKVISQNNLNDHVPHCCYKRVIGMSREEKETILLSD